MVVRLDLEHRGEPVADVDGAGVLARPLQHAFAGGRQRLQVHARALVAAVLRPHDGENTELSQSRLAAEHLDDLLVFLAGQAVALENVWSNGHRADVNTPWVTALRTDSNSTRPSALPT